MTWPNSKTYLERASISGRRDDNENAPQVLVKLSCWRQDVVDGSFDAAFACRKAESRKGH